MAERKSFRLMLKFLLTRREGPKLSALGGQQQGCRKNRVNLAFLVTVCIFMVAFYLWHVTLAFQL